MIDLSERVLNRLFERFEVVVIVNIYPRFYFKWSLRTAHLLFPENPTEGRDFPLYTPLLDDEDVLTTDFLGEQKQIFDDVIAFLLF